MARQSLMSKAKESYLKWRKKRKESMAFSELYELASQEKMERLEAKKRNNIMFFINYFIFSNIWFQLGNSKGYMEEKSYLMLVYLWSVSIVLIAMTVTWYRQKVRSPLLYEMIIILITIRNTIPMLDTTDFEFKKRLVETEYQKWELFVYIGLGQ